MARGLGPPPCGGTTVRGKVVILGAAEAGKSTLITTLCPNSMNLHVDGRTVAMDHGMLSRGSSCLSLVGVPGQQRFAAVRDALVAHALAAVWVHAAGAETDLSTTELIRRTALPYLVYVNLHGRGGGEWLTPTVLRRPRAVLVGDLLDPMRSEVDTLKMGIWKLAAELPIGAGSSS